MATHSTHPKHRQRSPWVPVVEMLRGMESLPHGCSHERIPGRDGFGDNPIMAGR